VPYRFRVFAAAMVLAAFAPAARAQDRPADPEMELSQLEAERMLSSILRSAPGGIGVVVDRVIVQVNDYIVQLTGYSREELLGKSARIFYPADEDYEFVGREKYRQIAERGTGTVETRWRTKEGEILEVILSSTPLDTADLSEGVVFTVTDITEKNRTARTLRDRTRTFLAGSLALIVLQLGLILALIRSSALRHKAAEALRLSQERFDLAMLAVNDGIWDWDIPSNTVYFDPRYYKIAGYEPGDFPHRFDEFEKRVHPDDLERVLAHSQAHIDGRVIQFDIEFRFLRKDGTWMWIRGRGKVVARDGAGKVLRMIGTHTDVTDKKAAEEDLRKSRATLDLVLNTIPQSVFWKDRDGRYLGCNQAFARDVGLEDPARILGKTDFDLPWTAEDAEAYRADDREVVESGRPKRHIVEPLQQADGARLWIDTTKVPLVDEGRVFGVLGIYEDVTERKLMEQRLWESTRMLNDVIDTIPVRVFWKDRAGRYLGCNRSFAQDAGKDRPEDVIGLDDFSLLWKDQAEAYRADDRSVVEQDQAKINYEEPMSSDGGRKWLRTSKIPLKDPEGRIYGILGVYEDITERRRVDEELKALNETLEQRILDRTRELDRMNSSLVKANEELQATLETLHEAQDSLVQSEKLAALGQLIAGIAHELNTPLGAIVSSNQSLIHLIGNRLEEASRTVAGLSPEVLTWFNAALKLSLGSRPLEEEASGRFRRRKGLAARLADCGRPIPDRLLDALLDLRLDGDPSIPALVRDHPDCPEAVYALDTLSSIKNITDVIAVAADKCSNVVSALLYYVRKEEDEDASSRVEIPKELDSLLTLYTNKTKYGVRIEKDYGCPGLVKGNRNQLNQVWMNLIQNALQAMDFRGTLGLSVREGDSRIVVEVRDTGPGVPAHLREKIFEPFFTTKKSGEGTGLGLDICRRIVEKHGGRIELESEPGRTLFRVLLPAWKDDSTA